MADFIDHSDEVKAKLAEAIEAALEAVGNTAVSHAKQNITAAGRINTGNLRNSISHLVDTGENAVYVGTNCEYAIYNEMGTGIYIAGGRKTPWVYVDEEGNGHRTSGMPPTHFLKNAAADHADEYERIAAAQIRRHMQ